MLRAQRLNNALQETYCKHRKTPSENPIPCLGRTVFAESSFTKRAFETPKCLFSVLPWITSFEMSHLFNLQMFCAHAFFHTEWKCYHIRAFHIIHIKSEPKVGAGLWGKVDWKARVKGCDCSAGSNPAHPYFKRLKSNSRRCQQVEATN